MLNRKKKISEDGVKFFTSVSEKHQNTYKCFKNYRSRGRENLNYRGGQLAYIKVIPEFGSPEGGKY